MPLIDQLPSPAPPCPFKLGSSGIRAGRGTRDVGPEIPSPGRKRAASDPARSKRPARVTKPTLSMASHAQDRESSEAESRDCPASFEAEHSVGLLSGGVGQGLPDRLCQLYRLTGQVTTTTLFKDGTNAVLQTARSGIEAQSAGVVTFKTDDASAR